METTASCRNLTLPRGSCNGSTGGCPRRVSRASAQVDEGHHDGLFLALHLALGVFSDTIRPMDKFLFGVGLVTPQILADKVGLKEFGVHPGHYSGLLSSDVVSSWALVGCLGCEWLSHPK